MSLTPKEIRKRADTEHWALNRYHARELADELERLKSVTQSHFNACEPLQARLKEEVERLQKENIELQVFDKLLLEGQFKDPAELNVKLATYREVLIEAGNDLQNIINVSRQSTMYGSAATQMLNIASKALASIRALKLEE